MKALSLLLMLALGAIATTASAQPVSQQPSIESLTMRYRCDGSKRFEVVYLNLTPGGSYASLIYQGRPVILRSLPTGSGARYADLDEQRGLRLATKGREATLGIMPADHTARERTLYRNCRATR